MKRRTFLRNLLATSVATTSFLYGNPFNPRMRFANAEGLGKTLIVVFQRGGCDGLNTVVPFGDDDYYRQRPTLAISPPNNSDPLSAISLNNGFFGLHPALNSFAEIYHQGDMAIFPAVHYTNGSRSHFDGQDYLESGYQRRLKDGWLYRHLSSSNAIGGLRGISFGAKLSTALRGEFAIPNFTDFDKFAVDDNNIMSTIRDAYRQGVPSAPDGANSNRHWTHRNGRTMFDNIDLINRLGPTDSSPDNGAEYPNSVYGRQMQQIARLIKAQAGLEVATLNSNGWDTHIKQGGSEGHHASLHSDFAAGIAALYRDLGPGRMNDVLILTMTEFGRTVRENASGGTDHGNASAWFTIGGEVQGGIKGNWPGLADETLNEGRYLAHTTDFRDILGEIVDRYLGNGHSLRNILPGHSYHPPGFL